MCISLAEIINGQNAQITYMNGWLKENGFGAPQDVICEDAEKATTDMRSNMPAMPGTTDSASATSHAAAHLLRFPVLMLLATVAVVAALL